MSEQERQQQLREAVLSAAARWAAGERVPVAELNKIERLCWAEPGQGVELDWGRQGGQSDER